ncbi:MAG: hypothetical protein ACYDIC_20550 [Desulfobaccales bacterium]
MRHPLRLVLPIFLAIILIPAHASLEAKKPLPVVAEVTIDIKGVGAIVGVSWGHGVLWFKGKKYPFHVEGLSLGDVGYAEIKARGKVYNLTKPRDLSGTYAALGAGVALAGGVAGLAMQNERGVVIDLSATQRGVKLNIGPQGLTIRMN